MEKYIKDEYMPFCFPLPSRCFLLSSLPLLSPSPSPFLPSHLDISVPSLPAGACLFQRNECS